MLTKLTIATLNAAFPKLWQGVEWPSGLDAETIKATILIDCSEFPLIYTNPLFLQTMLKSWSVRSTKRWEHYIKVHDAAYNPIWNYDRTEEIHEVTNGNTTGTATSVQDAYQTGFDSDALQQTNQDGTSANTSTDASNDYTHDAHIYGNVGVTTTQKMIQEELQLWDTFNIYHAIAEDFKREFCIMIY